MKLLTTLRLRSWKLLQQQEESGIIKELASSVRGKLGVGSLDFMILKDAFAVEIERTGIQIFKQ